MAQFSLDKISDDIDEYRIGQESLAKVIVDSDVNNLTPLYLLKAYQGDHSMEAGYELATELFAGQVVSFELEGKVLLRFNFSDKKNLDAYFGEQPYLLDILINLAWGILLKKLTLPSVGSSPVATASPTI